MATARRVMIRHVARDADVSIATLLVDRPFVGFGAATKEILRAASFRSASSCQKTEFPSRRVPPLNIESATSNPPSTLPASPARHDRAPPRTILNTGEIKA